MEEAKKPVRPEMFQHRLEQARQWPIGATEARQQLALSRVGGIGDWAARPGAGFFENERRNQSHTIVDEPHSRTTTRHATINAMRSFLYTKRITHVDMDVTGENTGPSSDTPMSVTIFP
jgi:hypothetical protein